MADDDLDEDFGLDDDMPSGESGVPSPTDFDDDDFDFDDDDFDYDDGEGGGNKFSALLADKKKLAMIVGGAVVGLGLLGGGAWWMFSGDEDGEMAQEEESAPRGGMGASVQLSLQQAANPGLTPQGTFGAGGVTGAGKLAAGAGAKLSVGAGAVGGVPAQNPAAGGKLTAAQPAATGATGGSTGYGGYDPQNTTQPLSAAAVGEIGVTVPAVLPQAAAQLGQPKKPQPLPPLNDPGLLERTDFGTLPRISPQGKEPWKTYARPYQVDANSPMVSLVVTGLGMSASLTEAAINHLPADVTLSFSAYGSGLKGWVEKARAMGHEVLLELPMESASFPADDPGPLAMMTTKKPGENLKLLNLMMSSAQGYVGFVGQQGSRFLKNKKAMGPVMGEIKSRGLFFMDPGTTEGSVALEMADTMQMARVISNQEISTNASPARIRAQLDTLVTMATQQGVSAATLHATPNAIRVIRDWNAAGLNAKLAPVTSLAGRQAY